MNDPAPTRNEASVAGFEEGAPGVTPPSSTTGRHGVFLTDVIIEMGFADKSQVDEAEESARRSGKTVEQLLLDGGRITESQLSLAIAERSGLDHVDLEQFGVDLGAAENVSRSVATRCSAVPIAFSDGALIVAVQDCVDSLALRRIETASEREVRPVIAALSSIKRLIEKLPEETSPEAAEPQVPRIKSPRELQVDDPQSPEAGEPSPEESSIEEPAAEEPALEEPALEEPAVEEPEAEEPAVEEPAVEEPKAEKAEIEEPAVEEPAVEEPEAEEPAVEEPAVPEPAPEEAAAEPPPEPDVKALSGFDGLSMDLGPVTMEPEEEQSTVQTPVTKEPEESKREHRLSREVIEAKGKIAELERRLEEVVDAAEEATETSEKLRALRRAIDESGP